MNSAIIGMTDFVWKKSEATVRQELVQKNSPGATKSLICHWIQRVYCKKLLTIFFFFKQIFFNWPINRVPDLSCRQYFPGRIVKATETAGQGYAVVMADSTVRVIVEYHCRVGKPISWRPSQKVRTCPPLYKTISNDTDNFSVMRYMIKKYWNRTLKKGETEKRTEFFFLLENYLC